MQALDTAHQTIMNGANHPNIVAAIEASGINIAFASVNGASQWVASDAVSAQAIIDAESLWLPFAKAVATQAATDKFNAIISAGRIIGAKTYQIDDASRSAMLNTWNNNVWPITWIAMDNSTISLTQAQFQAGGQNIITYYNALRLNLRTLKNAIAAAGTNAALQAIDLTSGWPSNP